MLCFLSLYLHPLNRPTSLFPTWSTHRYEKDLISSSLKSSSSSGSLPPLSLSSTTTNKGKKSYTSDSPTLLSLSPHDMQLQLPPPPPSASKSSSVLQVLDGQTPTTVYVFQSLYHRALPHVNLCIRACLEFTFSPSSST